MLFVITAWVDSVTMTLPITWVDEGAQGKDHQHRVLRLEGLWAAALQSLLPHGEGAGGKESLLQLPVKKALPVEICLCYSRYVSRATRSSPIIAYTFPYKYDSHENDLLLTQFLHWLSHVLKQFYKVPWLFLYRRHCGVLQIIDATTKLDIPPWMYPVFRFSGMNCYFLRHLHFFFIFHFIISTSGWLPFGSDFSHRNELKSLHRSYDI